jgi:hypothetical protein
VVAARLGFATLTTAAAARVRGRFYRLTSFRHLRRTARNIQSFERPKDDQAAPMLAASAAAFCMPDDISLVTTLCSSTAAAVDVTYSLTA